MSSLLPLMLIVTAAPAQKRKPLPVIDMHLHALAWDAQGPAPSYIGAPFRDLSVHDPKFNYRNVFTEALRTGAWADRRVSSPTSNDSMKILTLHSLKENNVYAVTSGENELVLDWQKSAPSRIIPALYWSFGSAKRAGHTVDSLEKLFGQGVFRVFGEIAIQYEGFSPSDTAFEPYLAMAERLDIPVGIHVGNGAPGAPYMGTTAYRARLHSALTMEEALIRHPKLRIYAMHAGWPMLDDLLATLYAHPQLHVDLAAICYFIPKKELYYYLERIVNAGFIKRIMFGSDNMVWPGAIKIGIDNINNAPFLTEDQKRDILFNNAARFLRLSKSEIENMYEQIN